MKTLTLLLLLANSLSAATYYVDVATGNNGDAGTSEGAAWADPGYASTQMGDGDLCYVKAGTYTVTTTTVGAAGPVKFAQASLRATMEGYSTTPGDRCVGGSKPVISADAALNPGSACKLIEAAGTINEPHVFIALRVDANSEPNTTCCLGASSQYSFFINCEAVEAAANGFETVSAIGCYSGANGQWGFYDVIVSHCYAESNVSYGYVNTIGAVVNCIARANGDGGFLNAYGTPFINCVAHGNTGFGFPSTRNNLFIGCVAVSNTTYGFSTADHSMLKLCASYGNGTSRNNATPMFDYDAITCTGDPFVNAAADDFTPDATANEGALLRAAGINPYGHSGYADVGAVQHQDAGGTNTIDPLSNTIPGL